MQFVKVASLSALILGAILATSGCATTAQSSALRVEPVLPAPPTRPALCDYRVVQRDEADEGTVVCAEPCGAEGAVFARVLLGGMVVPGLDWQPAGMAAGGTCAIEIRHIPVGGPYRVEFEIRGAAGSNDLNPQAAWNVDHLLVGDIWILAGQSNMEGQGDMVDVESPSPWVTCYGLNERWAIAEEPLHWLSEAVDPVHHLGESATQVAAEFKAPRAARDKGAGLGLTFAKELYGRTGVPIGLLPCAHRGTSMDQWDPARAPLGGWSLYGAMLRRFHAVGGKVRGVLWYQGEEDARPESENTYRAKLERFIACVRRDFGDARLPFYIVQLSRRIDYPQADEAWSTIREQQRRVGEEVPGVDTVAAIDLPLDDEIHIGTAGLKQLGRRLALAAYHDLFDAGAVRPGPRLQRAVVEDAARGIVRVYFDDVNGRLSPDAHIGGFSLHGTGGKTGPELYDVRVDPRRPSTVLCRAEGPVRVGTYLWYGYGRNPYCNLVDEQNLAVPAFGPIRLTDPGVQQAAAGKTPQAVATPLRTQ
jgi:sialate O-acetylesterase